MAGKLTTHVLDTARGIPAMDIALELWQVEMASGKRHLLKRCTTNQDGRTDIPLLSGDAFQPGTYELVFAMGDYFRSFPGVDHPPFLSDVPIRFTIPNPECHYHVPLLISPWAYSTYRGS